MTKLIEWLKRLLTQFFVWQMKRRVRKLRIDPCAQCPACGHSNGEIRFVADVQLADNTQGALVHRCKICDANWIEKPIIQAKEWAVALPEREVDNEFI